MVNTSEHTIETSSYWTKHSENEQILFIWKYFGGWENVESYFCQVAGFR